MQAGGYDPIENVHGMGYRLVPGSPTAGKA
jgi:hypothetical protein